MAGTDDEEIIVTIEPELDDALGGAAGAGEGVTKTVAKAAPAEDNEALGSLKTQFANMTQRANAAETETNRVARLAQEATARAEAAETEVIDTRKGSVDQGLESAQTLLKNAKEKYKRAFTDGDADAAADAQGDIAEATTTISKLKDAKADLLEAKPARKAPVEADQVRRAPSDPVEAYVQNRTEPTAAWIRAHPDYVTDPKKNAKLTAAHWDATGDGIAVDSPEYFAHVEKFVGIKPAAQQQRRPSAPVAPAGDVGGAPQGGKIEVSLKPHEARAATDGTLVWNWNDPNGKFKKGEPIGIKEMGRRKLAMQKEGRYDRTYTES